MSTIGTAQRKAQRTAAKASPWIETLGRWGYAARGIIYGLIGILAFMAAQGDGGATTDQRGAINTLANKPFGTAMLIAIGIGLIGFCLFRLVQAAFNPEQKKPLKRIGYALSGLAYGGFGYAAFMASMGQRAQDNGEQRTAQAMGLPFGEWAIAAIGVVIACVGLVQIYNGLSGKFMKSLDRASMSDAEEKLANAVGRTGLIARGFVFLVTGGLFTYAGMNQDPSRTGGIEDALAHIARMDYGPLLLSAVGLGLIAFMLYMFVQARYRKYEPVRPA